MITKEEIEKLANLARIKVSQDEISSLTNDIGSILSYIDEIKKINVEMGNTENVGSVYNISREDIVISSDKATRDSIIENAPYKEGEYIAVKKIISQD